MKKILSILTLALASLLLIFTGVNSVYAFDPFDPGTDSYEDLFYPYVEVTVDTFDEAEATLNSGDFYRLKELFGNPTVDGVIDLGFKMKINGFNIEVVVPSINPELLTIEYTSDFDVPLVPPDSEALIINHDGAMVAAVIEGDLLSVPFNLNPGDTIKFSIDEQIPWTSSYSYGRVRSYNDEIPQPDMILSESQVYIGYNASESQLPDFSATYFDEDNLVDFGAVAVWQSPYKNFRITASNGTTVLEEWTDVAAVVYEVHTNGEMDPRGSDKLTIYYWDDGSIATDTYEDTDGERAYFYGGFRAALTGQEHFATDVDAPEDVDFFVDYFQAWDDIDGDISDSIVVETDNYTANKDTLGTYSVTLSVTDSNDNESTLTFYITVADIIAPTVTGSDPAEVSYTEVFDTTDLNTWLASLTKSDNYNSSGDVTLTVSGHTAYLVASTVPGTYVLSVTAEDESGNESEPVLFDLVVVDDVDPVFDEPIEEISTTHNVTFTVAQIQAALIAVDEIDGDVSDSITLVSDTYSANKLNPGTWAMTFRATDESGNTVDHTVTIVVSDQVPGWFVVSYPTPPPSLILTPGFTPTLEQIITLLENTGKLPEGFDSEDVSINNYIAGVPGTYQLNIGGHNFTVKVLADDEPILPPLHPVAPTATDYSWILWTTLSVLALGGVAAYYFFNKKKARK